MSNQARHFSLARGVPPFFPLLNVPTSLPPHLFLLQALLTLLQKSGVALPEDLRTRQDLLAIVTREGLAS